MIESGVLAIDYGRQRVGVAVARGSLAEPVIILDREDNLIQKLKKIITSEKIGLIVVGVSEGEMAEESRTFGHELAKELSILVEFIDETLSSYEVHKAIANLSFKKKAGHIDHYAAAVILQRWLDERLDGS